MREADAGRDLGAAADPIVSVLGAVSVRRGGVLVSVPGRRLRTVLVALAMDPGRYRSASGLIEDVWGAEQPRAPANALHTQLSRLRSLLPDETLEQGPAGYRLALPRGAVDLTRAGAHVAAAERMAGSGRPDAAIAALADASELWRGEAGDDLPDGAVRDALRSEATRVRRSGERVRIDTAMAAGDYAAALPLLREACDAGPLDEPAHAMLMRGLAGTGRGNEALALYEAVRERLAERLGTDPSPDLQAVHLAILRGESSVRDDEPVAESAMPQSPPMPVAPRPIGLRAEPNALIGRDDDAAAVRGMLESSRVVTLLGPGGTGKTRLANRIGNAEAAGRRVAMIELVAVRSGEDVAAVVAGALGLGEGEVRPDRMLADAGRALRERTDPRTRLRTALDAQPMLLILDNCEQVVEGCADLVADLVASCAQLVVLATSRTPLRIAAESVYPLAPLPAEGVDAPAAALFEARARAVRPSAHLDRDAVARLCSALDGLPLAIELAAARVRTMSVEQIGARLADRFALLSGGDRTAPQRHRTLESVIEWSWNLLTGAEQYALRRLSLPPGGFTAEAARAIAGERPGAGERPADGKRPGDPAVDDAVAGLVDQSLLEVTEQPESAGLRYHMLATVREFGARRLASVPGERRAVADAFGAWAAGFSTRAAQRLIRSVTAEQVAVVETEQENLLAVLRRALDGPDPAVALPVLVVLGGFWTMRGAHSDAGVWAGRVEERVAVPGGAPGEVPAWALDPAVDTDVVYMSVLLIAAYRFFSQDRRGMARWRTLTRRLLRRRPAEDGQVDLVGRMLTAASPTGLGRILARGVRSSDPAVRGLAYSMRANAHENGGRRGAARRDGRAALELARSVGDRWGEGMGAQMLGQLAGQTGHHEEAVGYYRLAAEVLWEVGAYEESIQMRGFIAAALVGAGRTDAGRLEARGALDVGEGVAAASGDTGPASQYRAALAAALAEADLADGAIDEGVARYGAAIDDAVGVHGSETAAALDPYLSLLVAAAACAYAEHGYADRALELSGLLLRVVVPRFTTGMAGREGVVDLPVTGAVLLALAAVDIAADAAAGPSGAESAHADAVRDLALAGRANARQDYPSMSLGRWTEKARLPFGDDLVDAEERRAAALPRSGLAAALVAALKRRARRA